MASTSKPAKPAKATKATKAAAAPRATKAVPRKGALAAGAARASGERAKRRSTPMISSAPATPAPTAAAAATTPSTPAPTAAATAATTQATTEANAPADASAANTSRKHRPQPVAKPVPSRKAVARSGTRTTKPSRKPRAAEQRRAPATAAPSVPAAATGATDRRPARGTASSTTPPIRVLKAVKDTPEAPPQPPAPARAVTPGIEELLGAGIAAVRVASEAAGISPDDVEKYLASMLSFLRRRLTGDYRVDEFGFDEDFTRNFDLPVLRPLYRSWFRVEVRGIENIPAQGGGLVVANHSGTVAMDSLMTQVAVHDEHPAHRHLRMLGADLVFQTPVIGNIARKSGSTLAANPDAERLLSSGELCGVWPEGFKGVGKPFSERYKLQRFGRGGFVSAALKTGVPIIPCSIVGAEEIYPIIGNMRTVARLLGAPYAPITPTWPLLGPLGLIPLPSKWIIEFGSPVETADLGPGAADDPMLVFDLTDQVRETIQQTLYSLLMQRRSVFF
jgi:1-acyl-sn-glycerol-3-phosphate acyltransferase